MTLFVFDMDGTLTPARLPMKKNFANLFLEWQKTNKSFLVTGSDIKKVNEQVPQDVINAFEGIYCVMGNDLWRQGKLVYHNDFNPEKQLIADLEDFRANTLYPFDLYPNYIEKRTGMLNFSVLGRDCPYEARERYFIWDKQFKERENIQKFLSHKYPQYDFVLGGSISMDIVKKGCGKGQVARHLRNLYPDEKIMFLGDKTFPGGNDFELADELNKMTNTEVVQVATPDEVLKILNLA